MQLILVKILATGRGISKAFSTWRNTFMTFHPTGPVVEAEFESAINGQKKAFGDGIDFRKCG